MTLWRRERLPHSDHYDGERFFNPGAGAPTRDLAEVIRWRAKGGRAVWPLEIANQAYPPPPAQVALGTAAISFVNHATFLIRLAEAVVLTDPIFSRRCSPVSWAGPSRVRPPGIALDDLPRPDLVLLSHNHYDHMDLPTLRAVQRRDRRPVVTMLGNAAKLRRLGIEAVELDWWQEISLCGLRITATPARHFSARTPFDRNRTLWGGFMIAGATGQILFAGDSGAGAHWQEIGERLGSPAVALLPIGAYEPRWFMAPVHMNPSEAVEAHLALGAGRSIGMHFGTFQLTDEPIDAPLTDLAAASKAAGLDPETFTTHDFGETRLYALNGGMPA